MKTMLLIQNTLVATSALLLASLVSLPRASGAEISSDTSSVKVMTYNVNEGTDFVEVLGAQTFSDFVAAVQLTINNVRATNPPLRMQAIAHQIAIKQPDLVSLQEVTTWRVGPGPNPSHVEFDMLQELLAALAAQGLRYNVVMKVDEFDLQAPLPDLITFVEAQDRDVLLARGDEDDLQLSNAQKANFATLLTLPTLAGSFTIVRGWASVDVNFDGRQFRFIGTHLENVIPQIPATALVQQAQAAELLAGPANISLPVVIAGDFNSDADNPADLSFPTYAEIIGAGFSDAWASTHPGDPGFTCCQLPDSSNPTSILSQRIDLLFARGGAIAVNSSLAGAHRQDRIQGLWPSDHAGVRSSFKLPETDDVSHGTQRGAGGWQQ